MATMLSKSRQLGVKAQSGTGVEATLSAADFSGNRGSPRRSVEITRAERSLTRSSFTQLAKLPGERLGSLGFTDEMVGGGASSAAPWHASMIGMGCEKVAVKMLIVSSVSGGTFKAGQKIGNNATEGSATVTGVIVETYPGASAGQVKVWYVVTAGVFGGSGTIYNYAVSQVSATIDTGPADGGYRFRFRTETSSFTPTLMTVEERRGGERITLIDALASGSLSLKLGEAPMLTVDYKGIPVYDGATQNWRTGSAITSIPAVPNPAAVKNVPVIFRLADGTDVKSVLTEIPFDFGLTVTGRKTMNDDALVESGYIGTRHTDRRVTFRVDPERVLGATFPYEKLNAQGGSFEVIVKVGAPSGANGMIVIHAPAATSDGNDEDGDRDGIMTSPFQGLCTGSDDDELYIGHLFG